MHLTMLVAAAATLITSSLASPLDPSYGLTWGTADTKRGNSITCFNTGPPAPLANVTAYIDEFCTFADGALIQPNADNSAQVGTRPGTDSVETMITAGATAGGYVVNCTVCADIMTEIVNSCNVGSDEKQGGSLTPAGVDATFSVQMLLW